MSDFEHVNELWDTRQLGADEAFVALAAMTPEEKEAIKLAAISKEVKPK